MKFVDKFVLVPVEKWETIEKRENMTSKQSPAKENYADNFQKNQLTQMSPQPVNKKKKKRETEKIHHTNQIHQYSPPLKKRKKTQIVWNSDLRHLKGKGENNLPTSRITATVISRVPESYKNRVGAFLHYLKRSPDLKWSKTGVIYFKGTRIEDSNVADLAYHAVRENDNSKPSGYELFL